MGFWDTRRGGGEADGPHAGPKPLYRMVPAGAVYFVEVRPAPGASAETAVNALLHFLWLRSLAVTRDGRDTFFGRMGFGLTVVGGWEYV